VWAAGSAFLGGVRADSSTGEVGSNPSTSILYVNKERTSSSFAEWVEVGNRVAVGEVGVPIGVTGRDVSMGAQLLTIPISTRKMMDALIIFIHLLLVVLFRSPLLSNQKHTVNKIIHRYIINNDSQMTTLLRPPMHQHGWQAKSLPNQEELPLVGITGFPFWSLFCNINILNLAKSREINNILSPLSVHLAGKEFYGKWLISYRSNGYCCTNSGELFPDA
jgi:hypothetical protein